MEPTAAQTLDFPALEALRGRHPAWRLLRADNAPLVLSFLGRFFVEENRGATPASEVISALDDELYVRNQGDPDQARFPRPPAAYLDDWAEAGWLRRFYPHGSDEVHYDARPALEQAWAWVSNLRERTFVGTESRLHTVLELLRQIVHGADRDPESRLAELHRRRAELDREIAAVRAGDVPVLDATALRDRYQQFASTARELLSDFRQVEDNFRALDRSARERIASWEGSKGELLAELVASRADIGSSDQGRSFQAFYDFLLSGDRQQELSTLLAQLEQLSELGADRRLRTVHHDWSDAAERTQQTVRQISEQLRRFLDDQVWLENRRVLDLVRGIEALAMEVRGDPPESIQLDFDEPGVRVTLPVERPLHDARPPVRVSSLIEPEPESEIDVSSLFQQSYVDHARLAGNIREVVPPRTSALLTDIIRLFPLRDGVAEIVGYLALSDDDIEVSMDESDETYLDLSQDPEGGENTGQGVGVVRRVRLPKATVARR